jgi:hypothetical protein
MKRADKPIIYEAHALNRMAQRGVTREHVAASVRRPNASRPAKRKGARRLERSFSARRRLVVIAEEGANFIRLVSVWWS